MKTSENKRTAGMRWLKTLAWLFMVMMAVVVGSLALSTFLLPGVGEPSFNIHFETVPWGARLHIVAAGLVLILGAFQFHSGLRNPCKTLHRYCGRAYISLVLIAAVGGLVLAGHTHGGPATKLGFALLATIWFYSSLMAWLAVRAGNIALHRQWIIRSYALTFAGVTLRIQLVILQAVIGMSFEEAYAIVAWFSWIPNLLVAEWIFNQIPIRKTVRSQ